MRPPFGNESPERRSGDGRQEMAGSHSQRDKVLAVAGKAVKTAQGASDKHPDALGSREADGAVRSSITGLGGYFDNPRSPGRVAILSSRK